MAELEERLDDGGVLTLPCPCCGDEAAEADADGLFYEEQPLTCGCSGHVTVDEDGEEASVTIIDCACGVK